MTKVLPCKETTKLERTQLECGSVSQSKQHGVCDVIFFGEVASHAHVACHALAAAMRAVHGKAMDGMRLQQHSMTAIHPPWPACVDHHCRAHTTAVSLARRSHSETGHSVSAIEAGRRR
jgi:hypothetical protein